MEIEQPGGFSVRGRYISCKNHPHPMLGDIWTRDGARRNSFSARSEARGLAAARAARQHDLDDPAGVRAVRAHLAPGLPRA